jgi:hypothetical protein
VTDLPPSGDGLALNADVADAARPEFEREKVRLVALQRPDVVVERHSVDTGRTTCCDAHCLANWARRDIPLLRVLSLLPDGRVRLHSLAGTHALVTMAASDDRDPR